MKTDLLNSSITKAVLICVNDTIRSAEDSLNAMSDPVVGVDYLEEAKSFCIFADGSIHAWFEIYRNELDNMSQSDRVKITDAIYSELSELQEKIEKISEEQSVKKLINR